MIDEDYERCIFGLIDTYRLKYIFVAAKIIKTARYVINTIIHIRWCMKNVYPKKLNILMTVL